MKGGDFAAAAKGRRHKIPSFPLPSPAAEGERERGGGGEGEGRGEGTTESADFALMR